LITSLCFEHSKALPYSNLFRPWRGLFVNLRTTSQRKKLSNKFPSFSFKEGCPEYPKGGVVDTAFALHRSTINHHSRLNHQTYLLQHVWMHLLLQVSSRTLHIYLSYCCDKSDHLAIGLILSQYSPDSCLSVSIL